MGKITKLKLGRGSYHRIKKAESYKTANAETIRRIENILENLVNRLEVEGASLLISCLSDICISQAGRVNVEDGEASTNISSIFSGKTILSNRRYMKPIKSDGVVVGYLAIELKEEQGTDLDAFCDVYADQLMHELEMGQIKADLDKKSDALQKKKQELREIQEYNDNLLSITSHDLSSPLNAISGYLDLIDSCLQDETSLEQISRYHNRIQSGVHDVLDMLNQMSDVGKFEKGRMSPDKIKVDLNWVVRDVCHLLETNAKSKEIDLQVNVADQPVYIKADTVLLKRIIRNLLDNAVKYTENKGRIRVNVTETNGKARLQIEDNGKGISKTDLKRIFSPFVKLYESDDYTSKGIGLFVTSYFVDLLDGDINVESEEKKGSMFTVSFPTLNPFSVVAS